MVWNHFLNCQIFQAVCAQERDFSIHTLVVLCKYFSGKHIIKQQSDTTKINFFLKFILVASDCCLMRCLPEKYLHRTTRVWILKSLSCAHTDWKIWQFIKWFQTKTILKFYIQISHMNGYQKMPSQMNVAPWLNGMDIGYLWMRWGIDQSTLPWFENSNCICPCTAAGHLISVCHFEWNFELRKVINLIVMAGLGISCT